MSNRRPGKTKTTYTILVVDDSQESSRAISRHLTRANFKVEEANSGADAVGVIEQRCPDLVFMDLMMPGMSGIEAIRQIRDLYGHNFLPIIVLSGVAEKETWVEAFEAGANDFVAKDYDPKELIARVKTQLTMVQLNRELISKNTELEEEKELASHMQSHLLDNKFSSDSFSVDHYYRPFDKIGGDYFDAFKSDNWHHFLVGDVTGHNTSSALLMACCKVILNSLGQQLSDPLAIVTQANLYIRNIVKFHGYFSTLAIASYRDQSDEIEIVSAGHPPCYIFTNTGLHTLHSSGLPIGVRQQGDWKKYSFRFLPGDSLFLYTDGIIEVTNSEDDYFGRKRLERILMEQAGRPGKVIPALKEKIEEFSNGAISDDVTMLSVTRKA